MADDLRPIRRREDLPPLERAVSDALDELNVRCYGRVSGWVHPVEFLEFLAEEGHTVIAAEELERLRAALHTYENTITWFTTCHGCAKTLDSSYAETVRAEKAEAKLDRFRTFLDTNFRWWCSPNGVAAQYAKDLLEILDRDPS